MSLFEKVFKEKGINMTSSRRALFQVLENSKNHLTVDEILNRARKKDKTLGLATVYRTLNMLCELGLIEKHEFPNLEPAYEKVSGRRVTTIILLIWETVRLPNLRLTSWTSFWRKLRRRTVIRCLGIRLKYTEKKLKND